MRVVTVREALGGDYATSTRGWLEAFPLATAFVLFDELAHGQLPLGLVLISAVVQHLAAGAANGVAAVILRRRWTIIPVAWCFVSWALIGVARGVAAGAVAQFALGDTSYFAHEILTWVAITVVWMPTFVTTAVRMRERRALVNEGEALVRELEETAARGHDSAIALQERVMQIIRTSIGGAVDEIRQGIDALAASVSSDSFTRMRERLSVVAEDARIIVDRELPRAPREIDAGAMVTRRNLLASIDVELSRPLLMPFVTALVVSPVIVPSAVASIRAGEFPASIAGVVTAAVGLMLSSVIIGAFPRSESVRRRLSAQRIGFLLSGVSGSLIIAFANERLSAHDAVLLVALPVAVSLAAPFTSVAFGSRAANEALAAENENVRAELSALLAESEARDTAVREQVSSLMHGPIQGRLAACAMALNFAATADPPPSEARVQTLVEQVTSHLDLVADELARLESD